jgi:hypothetical protein
MGCGTTSAQAYESCGAPAQGLFGYPGPFTGFDSLYQTIAQRNAPPNAPADFAAICEANLRARGLIYFKNSPGDCGAPAKPASPLTGLFLSAGGAGGAIALTGLKSAGIFSGAATLGIGTAVTFAISGIEDIFAHHAEAVANEQQTICSVASYFNPLIAQIDQAVESGQITAQQGIAYLAQAANTAISGLATIEKACNAACVYQAILKAHVDFASSAYPAISPVASGAAPGAYNPILPGGASTVPDRATASIVPANPYPLALSTPTTATGSGTWIVVAVIVIALVLLLRMRR